MVGTTRWAQAVGARPYQDAEMAVSRLGLVQSISSTCCSHCWRRTLSASRAPAGHIRGLLSGPQRLAIQTRARSNGNG